MNPQGSAPTVPPGVARWRRLTLNAQKVDIDLDAEPIVQRSPYGGHHCLEERVLERAFAHLQRLVDDPDNLLPQQREAATEGLDVVRARLLLVRRAVREAEKATG